MTSFEIADKWRAELSALTLDLEQAAITIAAKAGVTRALRDRAIDTVAALAETEDPPNYLNEFDQFTPAYPFAASRTEPPIVLDVLLWRTTPVLTVPKHTPFERMHEDGHRYLVASDGLWLEVHRPWLRLLWPIGTTSPENLISTHATPFGTLKPSVEIIFGKVPHHLIRSFAERGRTSCPNERGAWLSWEHGHEGTEGRLVWSEPVDSEGTPGALHYTRPEHTANLSPCIDLHTHGTAPAFFSATDDADDAHDVKIAIVLGNLDQPIPTIAARLCCLGVFIPVTVRAEEVFGGAA